MPRSNREANLISAQTQIAAAWGAAAQDLGLTLVSPYALVQNGAVYHFIAWVEHFGGKRGTLICLPEQWADLGFAAAARVAGYYCSGLYPDSYAHYDREHFINTLRDWGWFGDSQSAPPWYAQASDNL